MGSPYEINCILPTRGLGRASVYALPPVLTPYPKGHPPDFPVLGNILKGGAIFDSEYLHILGVFGRLHV